jgi:hypothetical protein
MNLKDGVSTLKNRLESIQDQLEGQMKELDTREKKWTKLDKDVEEILKVQNDVLRLNIGGKKFAASTDTLLRTPDTLFYKLILSKKMDLNEEIFFDRSPSLFPAILDYLRTKKINYKKFTNEELKQLAAEAEYYEVIFFIIFNFRSVTLMTTSEISLNLLSLLN